ncbi:glycosyltransferase family 4 protein [Aestuariirhabdus haliotis]|uniref:glycosyltransferase family 4 protein n=1 Tax=Aestuariirhabdus haliotis TaxID=2918751 RepID=UPI0020BD8BB0|nr:glycosyltransferase family 4 protein [Aestuariirhabdus haliotis]MCL6419726.1 glycosyltransferase family 4 protein [Aestuariirhabdus haliotis]
MKILIVSQYFWPESFIINDVAIKLVEQGHEIVVATGKPNYPEGKIFDGYQAKGTTYELYMDRIEVVRAPLWPRGNGGATNLFLNYLSFVLSGLIYFPWMLRNKKFDRILVFSPSPVTQVIPAIILKWIKRAPLALWVQDLWPESLSATGFIKGKYQLKAVEVMVKILYAGCDLLLVQSRAFIDPVSHYADRNKIIYYPNSIDATKENSENPIPDELARELEGHFCIVFAGNLGTAQSLDTVVQAADHLKNDPLLRIVLVGSGSQFDWLKRKKLDLRLDNLILAGRFSMDQMPQIFERSSALLVSLKNDEIFSYTIPSKVQAYLAAGRPIIAALEGEGARVVNDSGAGLTCEPENVTALVSTIRKMSELPQQKRNAMGLAGRAYFDENFDMATQVESLVHLLEQSDGGSKG